MRRPRVAAVVGLVAVAALIATSCSRGSGGSDDGDRLNPKPGDVFLEPLDVIGPAPFTQSVALAPVPAVTSRGPSSGSSSNGLRSIAGTTAGLYAGSGSQQACDATTGANALAEDDAKAQAWVDALNDDPDLSWSGGSKLAAEDIATYVGELTSVILQSDTRVTNHAFSGGRAKAFQSVLQRGTAVMIDTHGVPRTRCASFGPLIPPSPAGSPKYRGTEWEGFEKTKLVAVTPGRRAAETFQLIDIHTSKSIEVFAGQNCLCDRTTQGSTTTTTEFFDEEATTSTTSRASRPTTTQRRPTPTSTTRVTTPPTTAATTTTAPASTSTTGG
jgi:hypothetical protein